MCAIIQNGLNPSLKWLHKTSVHTRHPARPCAWLQDALRMLAPGINRPLEVNPQGSVNGFYSQYISIIRYNRSIRRALSSMSAFVNRYKKTIGWITNNIGYITNNIGWITNNIGWSTELRHLSNSTQMVIYNLVQISPSNTSNCKISLYSQFEYYSLKDRNLWL